MKKFSLKPPPIGVQIVLGTLGLVVTWWLIIPKPNMDELREGHSMICPKCFDFGAYSVVLMVNLGIPVKSNFDSAFKTCDALTQEIAVGESAAIDWYRKKGLVPDTDSR